MGADCRIIKAGETDFPAVLSNIDTPPSVLYTRGDISLLKSNCMAVVGSRRCTRYGRDVTKMFVEGLVRNGFTIVSGLASGIDTVAHEAALACGGKTVAVLGGGFNNIYPPENTNLYNLICEKGLCISEYAPDVPPTRFSFPMRNRIISGISVGALVTEAGEKSGALITAYRALDQGKEVFAVPGSILTDTQKGANALITKGHALPVMSTEDITRRLGIEYRPEGKTSALQLDMEQERILNILKTDGEQHIDSLIVKTGMALPQLNSMLFTLELAGIIAKLPGNYFKAL